MLNSLLSMKKLKKGPKFKLPNVTKKKNHPITGVYQIYQWKVKQTSFNYHHSIESYTKFSKGFKLKTNKFVQSLGGEGDKDTGVKQANFHDG